MSTSRTEKPLKRALPADADSQRIVESAREHFFSHGFRSVTMDDLAEELAISKKTLYARFPSKIALLESVLADKFASVEAKLEEITRAYPHDFSAALHELLANTQRELDEIKPPFVRDMRQKAPQAFKIVERRRAELMIEILLAAVQAIVNPAKVEELGLTPKTGFASVVKVVLEGVITRKGRKT